MKHRMVTPIAHYGGRLCVSGFLRFGSKEPQLPPKAIMEMRVYRVHGRSNTPRVCPASTNLTPRQHAAQDDQHDVTARRRRANAPTYGLGQATAPRHSERRRRHYFGFGHPHRRDHGQCLRFVGAVDATGASDSSGRPSRVSPTPTTSTQRRHGHIGRVCRGVRSLETTPCARSPRQRPSRRHYTAPVSIVVFGVAGCSSWG